MAATFPPTVPRQRGEESSRTGNNHRMRNLRNHRALNNRHEQNSPDSLHLKSIELFQIVEAILKLLTSIATINGSVTMRAGMIHASM